MHYDYKIGEKYNDIALIKLKSPAEFVPKIWPACLAPENEITPADLADAQLIVAGFGRTDRNDREYNILGNWTINDRCCSLCRDETVRVADERIGDRISFACL